jgi:hypothetical protein
MRFSNFSPVVFLLGLGLAHNETGPGGHFWNTTTAHPAPTSSGFFANTSSIEEVATIKIQIGNLSGSGVINLSAATPSEAAQLSDLLDPTSFIN